MTPTLRSRQPLVWLVILLLLAVLLPHRVWTTLLVGLAALFGGTYVWADQLARHLTGERRLRFGWVAVGDRLEEQFTLVNRSVLPALWVEIRDQSTVPDYQTAVVRSVGGLGTIRWREAAVCHRRGLFQLGPWSLQTGDPLGFFEVTIPIERQQDIIIHPPIHGQLPVRLPLGRSSGRVQAPQRAWQATINAATIRDYLPDDPQHWIHWPTTARSGRLQVRQFDQDAAGDVWLLPDLYHANQVGSGAAGTEEHAVVLAASLAARSLRRNRAAGIAGYSAQPRLIPPAHGRGQRWKLLRTLALVRADGTLPLDRALIDLARIAQRGTTAVIITAADNADWLPSLLSLSRRGVQPTVILLERASFGGEGQTTALQTAIRRLGITATILRQGETGHRLDTPERRGHWEFRVTRTGRVITLRRPEEL